jgi:hypothetical protein
VNLQNSKRKNKIGVAYQMRRLLISETILVEQNPLEKTNLSCRGIATADAGANPEKPDE